MSEASQAAAFPCTPSWASVFAHLGSSAPDLKLQLAKVQEGEVDESITRSSTTLEQPTSPTGSDLLFPAVLASCTPTLPAQPTIRIANEEELSQRVQDVKSIGRRARVVRGVPSRNSTIVDLDVVEVAYLSPSPGLLPEPWDDAQSFVAPSPSTPKSVRSMGSPSQVSRPHTPTLQSWLPPSLHAGRMPEPLPSPQYQRQSGYNWDTMSLSNDMAWASSAPTLSVGEVPVTPTSVRSRTRIQLHDRTNASPLGPATRTGSPLPRRMLTEPAQSQSFRRVSGYRVESESADRAKLKEKKKALKKAKSEANLNLASRAKGFVRRVVSGKDTSVSRV
ncbi:hypothetical protein EXIGLDRAFT_305807 [Exidia glandulosa HHB12029]|uniref:Uncharacterized protein n=1 Tax=Exidia glandulosa HHB12029 TaxID=1314781 RepID=A0A165ZL93_EXIGL|nr:hypothetical protein EXIGLDRAFT_305807 [Exidia glandulosa HHB12029]